ncbi:ubiquitin family domain-containing protein [Ditylenchus destructor]|nr:ubiquitin family domain-containing protein [Ditylenchus destructor]
MFYCTQCTANFQSESDILRHLSIEHFRYFPYLCSHCDESGEIYPTATEDDMHEHVDKKHPGKETNFNVMKIHDTEAKLKVLIEECRLAGASQDPPTHHPRTIFPESSFELGEPAKKFQKSESTFTIFVNTMSHGKITLEVHKDDTVASLKEKLRAKNELPYDAFLFSDCVGRHLENDNVLSDYKIEKGSTVHVLPE